MKEFIRNIFLLYLFWFTLFLSGRIAFILYQYNFQFPEGFYNILISGWKLDWSAASYLIFIPAVLICINLFSNTAATRKIFFGYHYLIIPLVVILTLANIIVYKSWNTLLNSKALLYALQPVEMFASLTNKQLFFDLLSLFLFCFAFILLFKKLIRWDNFNKVDSKIFTAVLPIAFIAFLVIGIRGGLQELPVNESVADFSHNQVDNDITANNIWYLSNSIVKSGFENHNPYAELKNEEAVDILKQLYSRKESSIEIIKDSIRPNIVLLLLESWTADVIEPMGGLKNITPFFTSLADSGLLFTNIYATGRRTDQALPSIICGFPSQPDRSIMRYTDKIRKLPFITKVLDQQGYSSSFYYGGDLSFNNMHSFLLDAGFNDIIGKESFAANNQNSKWGAHDEYVLMKQANDLTHQKEPFFSMLLTLTSHEPFEIPTTPKFAGKNDSALFINAVNYSDESLKKYFAFAKQQLWYANTLFILVADHGHLLPLNREYYDPKSRKIPLLFYGETLKTKYRGKQDSTIGNQNDIATSLLNQLHLNTTPFTWSNDLFNPDANHFAYINADKFFCWKWDRGYYRYNSESRNIETDDYLKNPDKKEILKGIAYRQKLLDDFIAY